MPVQRSQTTDPISAQRDYVTSTRSLAVSILLTLSGGFLDAFTFVGHGHVFANSMTGNVVLLGVGAAAAGWADALRHLPPLAAFVAAILVSHLLDLASARGRAGFRHPAIACLILEICFLSIAACPWVAKSEAWLIPGVSFVATLQTMQFTHLEDLSYTSVMTTGNLRRAAHNLFSGLIPAYDPAPLRTARLLGTISACFLAGAVLGAYSTRHYHDLALWVVTAMLLGALASLFVGAAGSRLDVRKGKVIPP